MTAHLIALLVQRPFFGGLVVASFGMAVGCSEGGVGERVTAQGGQAPGGAMTGGSALSGGGMAASGTAPGGASGLGGTAGSGAVTGGSGAGAGGSSGGADGGTGPAVVDADGMNGKHLFGYQGWFACPGDGAAADRWVHWFRSNTPTAENATFDMWPDVSELGEDELFATNLSLADGAPARLFSSFKRATVVRHFAWMQEHGIDGVLVQRFLSDVRDPVTRAVRDQVLQNARAGAELHGRVFAVMYDISGAPEASLVADLQAEWRHLVDDLRVTESTRYLRHEGRPVLAVWGLGFSDRPGTPAQAKSIIADFKSGDAPVTLVGGVPTHWRTLTPNQDTKTDPAWAEVYRSFDVLSPWAVGRYADDAGADNFRQTSIEPDLAELGPLGVGYLPVVFPGFSWHNLNRESPLNQIPRRGGAFYWRQVHNALAAGSTMLYGAMFDEVDEGTAFFKVATGPADLPAQGTFLALDADGHDLPSDWYLRLAGIATRTLRGELVLTPELPLSLP
jgi:hypothetical protein